VFRNIDNQNQGFVNVGLCGNLLHQTTSNVLNAINQKCRIIFALVVGFIILRQLLLLNHKLCNNEKTKNSYNRVLCLFIRIRPLCRCAAPLTSLFSFAIFLFRSLSTWLFLDIRPKIVYNCDQVINRGSKYDARSSNLGLCNSL